MFDPVKDRLLFLSRDVVGRVVDTNYVYLDALMCGYIPHCVVFEASYFLKLPKVFLYFLSGSRSLR